MSDTTIYEPYILALPGTGCHCFGIVARPIDAHTALCGGERLIGRERDGPYRKADIRLHGKVNSKLPWRKAVQPRHLVDVVDSNQ